MSDNTEMLRKSFAAKLNTLVDDDLYSEIMHIFDETVNGYEVTKKSTELITVTDIPEMVKVFIASKHVKNLSFDTLKQYKYKLTNFFNSVQKPYDRVTATDVRLYLDMYKTTHKVSNSTLENTRIIINTFYEWLTINDYIQKNPVAKVEHIKYQYNQREPLTEYELKLLQYHCEDVREKAMVDLFFSTGIRVTECSDIKVGDIDWTNRMIHIPHGKGDKPRTVFFSAEAELSMKMYLQQRKYDSEYLFASTRSPYNKISKRSFQIALKRIGERCGVVAFPHKLRHTFATQCLKGGMPLDRLQVLMGHSSPRTTLIYAKQDISDLKHEHQRVFAC